MKSTDLRAKARAIFGSAVAEPMPNQPNGAKALQQRANARPIPTYKVGGVVKKADGGMMKPKLSAAERKVGDALMMTRKGKEIMAAQKQMEADKEKAMAAKRAKADKLLGITAKKDGGKACGGKAGKYAKGGDITAERVAARMAAGNYKKGGNVKKYADGSKVDAMLSKARSDIESMKKNAAKFAPKANVKKIQDVAATIVDPNKPVSPGNDIRKPVVITPPKPVSPGNDIRKPVGATTLPQATDPVRPRPGNTGDVLNVPGGDIVIPPAPQFPTMKKGGKVKTSSDTARKLATEMGGMKKGGKAKDGLAVMIAIGSPKKPVKKAVGGAGKVRKGMAPIKKAQGGAAKVRKGMMSPEGKILDAIGKARGK